MIFLTDTLVPKEPSQSGEISPAETLSAASHMNVSVPFTFRNFSFHVAGSIPNELTAQISVRDLPFT